MQLSRSLLVATTFSFASVHAFAGQGLPSNLHPKSYCEVLAGVGYKAKPFNAKTGGCSTEAIALSATQGRNGLSNTLAFYSMGKWDNFSKLDRVSLILNVNAEKETAPAHKELARVAGALAVALTGDAVPAMQKAIAAGKSTQLNAGVWDVRVDYSKWPTGLGHDISVRFTPAK